MKKLFTALTLGALLVFGSMAMANGNPPVIGTGNYDIEAHSKAGDIDYDTHGISNGFAGGISGVGGMANSQAHGGIINGTISGSVSAVGGGATNTEAYRFHPGIGDRSIGVGSSSSNYATTGGHVHVGVDPDNSPAYGLAYGSMSGIAGQGTLNVSTLGESPRYFDTEGKTTGIAGQGSIGAFSGKVKAESGHDSYYLDSYAGAGIGAQIDMYGDSYSNSYRFVDWTRGSKTEGMGTNVGANTNVYSSGYSTDWDNGYADSYSNLNGGYVVVGGAATKTVQSSRDGGLGTASAVGVYTGAGNLGSNFSGSAHGGSHTQITTVGGMNGSVVRSSANMTVTATSGNLP